MARYRILASVRKETKRPRSNDSAESVSWRQRLKRSKIINSEAVFERVWKSDLLGVERREVDSEITQNHVWHFGGALEELIS